MSDKLLPLCERVFEENVDRILNARPGQPVWVESLIAAGNDVPIDYLVRLKAAVAARQQAGKSGDPIAR